MTETSTDDLARFGLPAELEASIRDRLPGIVRAIEADRAPGLAPSIVGVVPAWATIDLDRARAALALSPGIRPAADPVLGARALVIGADLGRASQSGASNAAGSSASPQSARQQPIVLLEPSTEGPVAAALARHGEGWVAAYLVTDTDAAERLRATDHRLGTELPGPLGPGRIVLGGPRDGPFLLVVHAEPSAAEREAASAAGLEPEPERGSGPEPP